MPGIFLDYCSHWVSGLGAWDAPYDIPLYIYN